MATVREEDLEVALRHAAVSLVSAAIILRQRGAHVWTDFAMDAIDAYVVARPEETPWWASEFFPRSDVAVSP